jgi:hypothetical protein
MKQTVVSSGRDVGIIVFFSITSVENFDKKKE